MDFKWIVFVVMAWIVVALLAGVAEGSLVGGSYDPDTGEPTAAGTLSSFLDGDFFQRAGALADMMTFNFPAIFTGSWAILRWIFFIPFVTAFAVTMLGYILAHIPVVGRGS